VKFDYELAHLHDEQLASTRQLEQVEALAQASELAVA